MKPVPTSNCCRGSRVLTRSRSQSHCRGVDGYTRPLQAIRFPRVPVTPSATLCSCRCAPNRSAAITTTCLSCSCNKPLTARAGLAAHLGLRQEPMLLSLRIQTRSSRRRSVHRVRAMAWIANPMSLQLLPVGEPTAGAVHRAVRSSCLLSRGCAFAAGTTYPGRIPACTLHLASCFGGEVSPAFHHRLKLHGQGTSDYGDWWTRTTATALRRIANRRSIRSLRH